jgi:hypothetical protein
VGRGAGSDGRSRILAITDSQFVEVVEKVKRIGIDAVGAGTFQFILAEAACTHSDAEGVTPAPAHAGIFIMPFPPGFHKMRREFNGCRLQLTDERSGEKNFRD